MSLIQGVGSLEWGAWERTSWGRLALFRELCPEDFCKGRERPPKVKGHNFEATQKTCSEEPSPSFLRCRLKVRDPGQNQLDGVSTCAGGGIVCEEFDLSGVQAGLGQEPQRMLRIVLGGIAGGLRERTGSTKMSK